MDRPACPKCKHLMQDGRISPTGGETLAYMPGEESWVIKGTTRISRGLACPNCGCVEIYLDLGQLKKAGA